MINLEQLENLAKKLIDFDTENFDDKPGGYTLELLEFVRDFLSDHGIGSKIHRYILKKETDGHIVELGQRGILVSDFDQGKPIVLLQGHADTVPIAGRYGKDICRIEEGVIYGRGAVDMKGSLTAMILALVRLKAEASSDIQPVLVITSDEEAGNFAGIRKFLEICEQAKPDIRFAICGEATDFEIKRDFLGAMYLRFLFLGRSGHAAHKERGDNAIEKAAGFLSELIAYQEKLQGDEPGLGRAVLNIGTIHGGGKVNQIPTRCEIEVSLRSVKDNLTYRKELEEMAGNNGGAMETVFAFEPVRLGEDRHLTRLATACSKSSATPMKEFTEATLLNLDGIKTTVFGPGNPLLNHSDEERIASADILRYQEILEAFIRSLSDQN